jgi:hypothetical protein
VINVHHTFFNVDEDTPEALFGNEVVNLYPSGKHESVREPNGAWFGPGGYQKKRMSGLLVFRRLTTDNIHRVSVRPKLWHHPYANNPLTPDLWKLDQLVPVTKTGRYQSKDGIHPAEILGIDLQQMPR